MNESFKQEVKNRWGNTKAYTEYLDKTKKYSAETFDSLSKEWDNIFEIFASCLENNNSPSSDEAQTLVRKLQDFITNNYYECNNAILSNLGLMYITNERFKQNIDKYKVGTAEFINQSIILYTTKQ